MWLWYNEAKKIDFVIYYAVTENISADNRGMV